MPISEQRTADGNRPLEGRSSVARVLTTDALAQAITTDILSGRISAGTHLAEVEMAEAYGVSRQTLRLALGVLLNRGLLRREAHRGSWVARLDEEDLRDLYGFRELIEVEAIRHMAHASTADQLPLVAAVERFRSLGTDARWDEVSDADFAFHRALVASQGSLRRARAHEQLCNETRLSLVPARRYRSGAYMYQEHAEILRVIQSGDQDAAAARLRRHLNLGLDWLIADLHGEQPVDGL